MAYKRQLSMHLPSPNQVLTHAARAAAKQLNNFSHSVAARGARQGPWSGQHLPDGAAHFHVEAAASLPRQTTSGKTGQTTSGNYARAAFGCFFQIPLPNVTGLPPAARAKARPGQSKLFVVTGLDIA